jgi:hypothetical protein
MTAEEAAAVGVPASAPRPQSSIVQSGRPCWRIRLAIAHPENEAGSCQHVSVCAELS